MPFRTDTSFDRKTDLAWFNLQSQWVVVTYTHQDKWKGPVPSFKADKMPNTMAKLNSKTPLIVVAYGMSITRGMDVSGFDSVPPFMPSYADLFAYQIKKKFKYEDITLFNAALPGATVDWGAKYAENYVNPLKPDLVILDFGMNDFWRLTPEQFTAYIQTIMNKVRAGNPKVEFLLLSNLLFDPDYILDSDKTKNWYLANMKGYNTQLQELEKPGVIDLDMTTLSEVIYQNKKAKDCLANPLHPNDYLARWYAQSMVALFDQQDQTLPAK
jgi:lysophospholipase L1-like esterase